jgi:hypothetical protein
MYGLFGSYGLFLASSAFPTMFLYCSVCSIGTFIFPILGSHPSGLVLFHSASIIFLACIECRICSPVNQVFSPSHRPSEVIISIGMSSSIPCPHTVQSHLCILVSSLVSLLSSIVGISFPPSIAHFVSVAFDNISFIRFPVIWASCRTSPSTRGFFDLQFLNTYANVFEAKDVELKTVRAFVFIHFLLMWAHDPFMNV